MSTAEDMTTAQFKAACKRHRFLNSNLMGYYWLPGTSTHVSVWKVGKRRRDQLAYLIQEQRRLIGKSESD